MAEDSSPLWLVGRVGRPVGRDGECVIQPQSGDPEDLRRVAGAPVRVVREGADPMAESPRTWENLRWHSGRAIGRFSGLMSREAIADRRHWQLWVDRRDLPSLEEPDTWWAADLVGCRAFQVGAQDTDLGPVVAISEGPVQDCLVIERPGGARVQVPFLRAFLEEVDVRGGRIRLDLPEGLVED